MRNRNLDPNRPHHPGGTPPFIASDEQRQVVLVMASNGNSQAAMARALRCSVPTISRHFRGELDTGFEDVKARLEASLVKQGLAGNVNAIRLWLGRHCPEWRVAAWQTPAEPPPDQGEQGPVRFYLPSNGRDQPENVGPIIDGQSEPSRNHDEPSRDHDEPSAETAAA